MKLGIIGYGRMASAIYESCATKLTHCYVYDSDKHKQLEIEKNPHLTYSSINDMFDQSDIILLAIKPQQLNAVLKECPQKTHATIVSILAGCQIKKLEYYFSDRTPIVRAMPNTAIRIKKGCTVLCHNTSCSNEHLTEATRLFKDGSKVIQLPETCFDEVTALSGRGPAFFLSISRSDVTCCD